MLAPHDSNQRSVGGEGLELVPVVRTHDHQVSPQAESQLTAEVQGPPAGVGTQGHMKPTVPVQNVDLGGALVLPLRKGCQDGPIPAHQFRSRHLPWALASAGPVERAPEVPVGVENRDGPGVRVPRDDRVARPGFHVAETRPGELAGPFAQSTPRGQVRPGSVEHPQLARRTVHHDDPSVSQLRRVPGVAEQIRILAIHIADRHVRLQPDHPVEPRALLGAGVLDDPDAGAVPGFGEGKAGPVLDPDVGALDVGVAGSPGRGDVGLVPVLLAGQHTQGNDCGGESSLHAMFLSECSAREGCDHPGGCSLPGPCILTRSERPGYPARETRSGYRSESVRRHGTTGPLHRTGSVDSEPPDVNHD